MTYASITQEHFWLTLFLFPWALSLFLWWRCRIHKASAERPQPTDEPDYQGEAMILSAQMRKLRENLQELGKRHGELLLETAEHRMDSLGVEGAVFEIEDALIQIRSLGAHSDKESTRAMVRLTSLAGRVRKKGKHQG